MVKCIKILYITNRCISAKYFFIYSNIRDLIIKSNYFKNFEQFLICANLSF